MIQSAKKLYRQLFRPGVGEVTRFAIDGIGGTVRTGSQQTSNERVTLYINDVPVMTAPVQMDGNGYGTFEFGVNDLWRFAQRTDALSVQYGDKALRMPSGGTSHPPLRNGRESLDALKRRFARGEAFDREGKIAFLPKDQDTAWQDGVLSLYGEVAKVIKGVTGSEAFLYSGTLLGYVRENGFIPHDKDMDCGYLSQAANAEEAQREFVEVGRALIAAGYQVTPKASCIAVRDREGSRDMVDIAHLFRKPNGFVGFPFGTVGVEEVPAEDFLPVQESTLSGHPVTVPNRPDRVVAHVYGDDWRIPNPDFKWKDARRRRDPQALLSYTDRTRLAMDDFYAHEADVTPSEFAQWVCTRTDGVAFVIDLGCGNGRDSSFFAQAGYPVAAVDVSTYAVEAAKKHVAKHSDIHVVETDLLEAGRLAALRGEVPGTGNALFYARFFLNGLTAKQDRIFFEQLGSAAETGDLVALEHRTDLDATRKKARFRSFRRFVPPAETLQQLQERGFEIVEQASGTGLAKFEREDPEVIRILARKK
ncbi:methyltransferase domain-containing protein [Arthrobacter sp. NPDC055138]